MAWDGGGERDRLEEGWAHTKRGSCMARFGARERERPWGGGLGSKSKGLGKGYPGGFDGVRWCQVLGCQGGAGCWVLGAGCPARARGLTESWPASTS